MPAMSGKEIYETLKNNRSKFDEAKHCALILDVMMDKNRGRLSAFCAEVLISDMTFYNWMKKSELLLECYGLGKMLARENWEIEGDVIAHEVMLPGAVNNRLEVWKMKAWSNFQIGRVSKVRLNLDPDASPNQHYSQLIKQAASGEFTASEIKQLMEAINVGLNSHQVIALQEEINQLKADLATMTENSGADNPFATKRIEKKD